MRKRHVWNHLYFGSLRVREDSLATDGIDTVILIRAEVFRQTLSANRSTEHPAQRHTVNDAAVDGKAHDATRKLVHHEENPIGSQRCGFAAEQIAAPQTVLHVAEKGEPGWTLRVWVRLIIARSGYGEPHLYQSRRRKPTRSAGQCGDSPSWDYVVSLPRRH